MERKEVIRGAYRMTGGNNFYDGMITCSTLSGKAVCRLVWAMNKAENNAYLEKALSRYREEEPRGECVLVIEGKPEEELIREKQEAWKEMTPEQHVGMYESQGIPRKEAMRLAAKDRGVSRREIYQALLSDSGEE